mmetsp:Transcript_13429/g.27054  ORF Transcript_13429/g.27054 Transcript_13429/m.27054 type:complete len:114 (-) Transcript_13429:518-859(-)|eukprot:CAMPEP_0174711236 /NCGR_PEP_ID=MMETSP1094-20130205/12625_1 /TAXON_ID=156173 /ORGANISM="Chrysochromulina brevifilum, Strain UTEX LB 985" /LENGTH=113 /DNA_ID=CAMNT_0015910145 /DNA_START=660 /DNA_END=1001 /DNA_ORIENTATION=-
MPNEVEQIEQRVGNTRSGATFVSTNVRIISGAKALWHSGTANQITLTKMVSEYCVTNPKNAARMRLRPLDKVTLASVVVPSRDYLSDWMAKPGHEYQLASERPESDITKKGER